MCFPPWGRKVSGFAVKTEKKSSILFIKVYFRHCVINPAWKQRGLDSLCLLPKNEVNKHANMSFPMWPSSLWGQQGLTKFTQHMNKAWITSNHIFIKLNFKGCVLFVLKCYVHCYVHMNVGCVGFVPFWFCDAGKPKLWHRTMTFSWPLTLPADDSHNRDRKLLLLWCFIECCLICTSKKKKKKSFEFLVLFGTDVCQTHHTDVLLIVPLLTDEHLLGSRCQ